LQTSGIVDYLEKLVNTNVENEDEENKNLVDVEFNAFLEIKVSPYLPIKFWKKMILKCNFS